MKKLSKIDESIWSDMQRRAEGSDIRREDKGSKIAIRNKANRILKALEGSKICKDLEMDEQSFFHTIGDTNLYFDQDLEKLDISDNDVYGCIHINYMNIEYNDDLLALESLCIQDGIPYEYEGDVFNISLWVDYLYDSSSNDYDDFDNNANPSSWVYLQDDDIWVSDEQGIFDPTSASDDFLTELFNIITPIVNPKTIYKK